jgi:hypothetical protein
LEKSYFLGASTKIIFTLDSNIDYFLDRENVDFQTAETYLRRLRLFIENLGNEPARDCQADRDGGQNAIIGIVDN